MGIFTTIGNDFESAIGSFVSGTAANVIGVISPWMLGAVTLYFLITGYMIMAGRISEPLSDILIKGAKIALVAMVGLNSGEFMSYVANAVTSLEKDLLSAVGGKNATSIYTILDDSYQKGWDGIAQAFQQAGALSFMTEAGAVLMLLLTGVIGICGLVAISCIGAGIVLLAKMALVVTLGLGPLFICCLMFPATAGWFDSWLRTCLNYVLTTVIVAAFIVIFINVYLKVVSGLTDLFASGSDAEGLASGALAYSVLILLVAIVSSYVMLQAPSIASSLAGGISVAGTSLTTMIRQSAGQVAGGAKAAAEGASNAGKMTFGAANVASRGAAERGAASVSGGLSRNVSNRYAQWMRRDGSNSINS